MHAVWQRSRGEAGSSIQGPSGVRGRAVPEILAHLSTMQRNERIVIPEQQRKQGRGKSQQDLTNTHQENQISTKGNKSLLVAWISFLWAALYFRHL